MSTMTYRVTVDGHGVTMLAPPGTTLEQARESARLRFGAGRVSSVEPITTAPKKGARHAR